MCIRDRFRIDHCTVNHDAPVQMRARGAPCFSGTPDSLTFAYSIAGFHVDPLKVAVHGDQPVAMVDKDRSTVEKISIDRQHPATRARLDRCAARYRHIKAGMWCARLSVEETMQTETPGQPPFNGKDESQIGILRSAPVVFQFRDDRELAVSASLIFRRKLYLARIFKGDVLLRINFCVDHEVLYFCYVAHFDAQLMRTRRHIKWQTDHRVP